MDLKIKDVADLLNVSETTIRRWLADGKIPAYRINSQYRFSKTEIEDWVMGQKINKAHDTSTFNEQKEQSGSINGEEQAKPSQGQGIQQFSLFRALNKGKVIKNAQGKTKDEIIRSTMKEMAKDMDLDAEVLSELLLDREHLQSTALNNGIALPHTRDFLLNAHHDVVTIVFPEEPIEFGALDGQPVHTLFFLFACEDKRHLHLLAKIAHLSSDPKTLEFLQRKPSKEQLLTYVKDWESQIKKIEG